LNRPAPGGGPPEKERGPVCETGPAQGNFNLKGEPEDTEALIRAQDLRAADLATVVAQALNGVSRDGGYAWTCRCPSCGTPGALEATTPDHKKSWRVGDRARLRCSQGCEPVRIFVALVVRGCLTGSMAEKCLSRDGRDPKALRPILRQLQPAPAQQQPRAERRDQKPNRDQLHAAAMKLFAPRVPK
jgi:hypothetical protein